MGFIPLVFETSASTNSAIRVSEQFANVNQLFDSSKFLSRVQ